MDRMIDRREIDPLKAIVLYNSGHSWADIGRILAAEKGRRSPFLAISVYRVVRAYDRGATTSAAPSSRPGRARS